MKSTLSKKEAEAYLYSLPFKEDYKKSKEKFITANVNYLAERAAIEKRDITLSEIQDSVDFLVNSLESDIDFGADDSGAGKGATGGQGNQNQASQELAEVQKEIDRLLMKPLSMQVDNRLNILRDREEALQKALR